MDSSSFLNTTTNDIPNSTPVNIPNSNSIDFNSPLYVQSSDIPGIPLVSTLFSGVGYSGWRRNMLRAISGRYKIGFLDGSCPRPSDDSPTLRKWERVNDIVTSWILNSMTKEISDSVVYADTAEEVWGELEERYGQINGVRIFELKKELASISQGSLGIAAYFNKIKTLWDELGLIHKNHSINCTCGAKKAFHKIEEEQRLYQFLMGLNETYVGVRSNILMMSPLPSVGHAYNMLLSDEKQRQVQPGIQMDPGSASFIASNNTRSQQNNFRPPQGSQTQINLRNNQGYNNNASQRNNNRGNNYQRNDRISQKRNVVCHYCKIVGHTIDQFYKNPANRRGAANAATQQGDLSMHPGPPNVNTNTQFGNYSQAYSSGYSSGYSPPGGSTSGQSAAGCLPQSQPPGYSQFSPLPGLTKDQYDQLISMLQQHNVSDNPNCSPMLDPHIIHAPVAKGLGVRGGVESHIGCG